MIDFEPTEEQQVVVATVHQFAAREIRAAARDCDESGAIPRELLERAHALGLVANALPESCGGGGERSAVTACLVAEELAWGDLAIALAILSPALVALPLLDFGSEEQRARHLARYAGAAFRPGALALVEPRLGADPFRPAAAARREPGGFVLDGTKCFVPWLDGDDWVLVFAREDGSPQGFLVPRAAEGLAAVPERNMGLGALPTAELVLEGVRVPAAARLGGEKGCDLPALVARGRVGLAACGVGVARAAFEIARDYARQRETFGAPIATRQSIAFALADMAIEIDGARLLTWEAAWCLDAGAEALREATLAVDQVRRVALKVADGAVQVLGGHGYTREYLPELQLRNARGLAVFEGLIQV